MSRYAERTRIGADRSRGEIERTLQRYGADQFLYGWRDGSAIVGFRMKARMVRFVLPMPSREDFNRSPRGRQRCKNTVQQAWEQATRQRWRALALIIKAKLEAVDAGISQFDDEFLAHIVLPDNRTVGECLAPQIAAAYESGRMPKLLPAHQQEVAG